MANIKDYLFIDTNIFRSMEYKELYKKIKSLDKEYHIVIPAAQLHELQKHFIRKFNYSDFKGIKSEWNKFEDHISKYGNREHEKKIKDLKSNIEAMEKEVVKIVRERYDEIMDIIKKSIIICCDTHHFDGARNRVDSEYPPYVSKEGDSHKHYDSLFWETLLFSDETKIPSSSVLWIYTQDGGFLSDNKQDIHPTLKLEWEVIKKGTLSLYKAVSDKENSEETEPLSPEDTDNSINPRIIPFQYLHATAGRLELHILRREISRLEEEIRRTKPIELIDNAEEFEEQIWDLASRIKLSCRNSREFHMMLSELDAVRSLLKRRKRNY